MKYLRARLERLTAENRVLRRAQRGGSRDDVALQLEVELQLKDQARRIPRREMRAPRQ